jgi:hypothetical protein
MLEKIKDMFSTPPDQDVLMAYQYKLPHSIIVDIKKSDDGFIARVEKINDKSIDDTTFLTEADSLTDLVTEVNDMLLTYLDFPEEVKPRMPQLLPPEFAFQEFAKLTSQTEKALAFTK